MIYRNATVDDISAIVQLQKKYNITLQPLVKKTDPMAS
jgi:hypothetical protein